MDGRSENPNLDQHLDGIIADLRERGITPRSLNVIRYAIEIGLPDTIAADLAALLERRIQMGYAL